MFGQACSIFVVLILQGPTLSAAYQVETKAEYLKYLDAASVYHRDDGSQYIVFDVKSCNEVSINLLDLQSRVMVMISLRSGPHDSGIIECLEDQCTTQQIEMLNLTFCNDLASFWIKCSASEIKVGSGCEVDTSTLMAGSPANAFALQNTSFSSTKPASWRFGESSACEAKKTPTTAQPATPSNTTDSGQENTSSETDNQSKVETTKAKSLATLVSTAQFRVIISMAVLTLTLQELQ